MGFNWKRFGMMVTISMVIAFVVVYGGGLINGAPEGEAEFEQQFIDMMVPHHEGALAMAQLAQQRGEHAEIKALAEDIIAGQTPEIEQMKAWRQAWYGSSETPALSAVPMLDSMSGMGGMSQPMDMAAEVEELRSAPEPFDRAFIDAMIAHHQSAIDAAELGQARASRPEIKDLAAQIIAAQRAEIEQLRAWRKQWYP